MLMKDLYIKVLDVNSKTSNHELIEECLDFFGLYGLNDISDTQLAYFCKIKCLI